MDPECLSEDELNFELFVRSAVVQGAGQYKTAILRGHLAAESEDTISYPEVPIDFTLEGEICKSKLKNVSNMVRLFKFDENHQEFKYIKSKILHIRHRISRFPDDDEFCEIKTKLLTKAVFLLDVLKTKANTSELMLDDPNIENDLIDLSTDSILSHSSTDSGR